MPPQNVYQRSNSGLVAPGNYTVTVVDDNGCFGIASYTIDSPDDLELDVMVVQPSDGETDGSATIDAFGGTPDYEYFWSNGSNDENFDDQLAPGIYQVTVIDANGCEEIIEFEIYEPLNVSVEFESEVCIDECNGYIIKNARILRPC